MSSDQEDRIVRLIKGTATDPGAYARIAYPWGEGDLAKSSGPPAYGNPVFSIALKPTSQIQKLVLLHCV